MAPRRRGVWPLPCGLQTATAPLTSCNRKLYSLEPRRLGHHWLHSFVKACRGQGRTCVCHSHVPQAVPCMPAGPSSTLAPPGPEGHMDHNHTGRTVATWCTVFNHCRRWLVCLGQAFVPRAVADRTQAGGARGLSPCMWLGLLHPMAPLYVAFVLFCTIGGVPRRCSCGRCFVMWW